LTLSNAAERLSPQPCRKFMRRRPMLDIVYLALGVGLFGLMAAYARWAANG
jgi:hypothetical protein